MNEQSLIRKATRLFPILPSTPVKAVRHARRAWVRSALYLQARPPVRGFWRHILIND